MQFKLTDEVVFEYLKHKKKLTAKEASVHFNRCQSTLRPFLKRLCENGMATRVNRRVGKHGREWVYYPSAKEYREHFISDGISILNKAFGIVYPSFHGGNKY